MSWVGVEQPAADYYGGFGGLQTVAVFLQGFQGRITIQATLDSTPDPDSGWFDVTILESVSGALTENRSINIPGNFVWMRVQVSEFSAGTISKMTVSY